MTPLESILALGWVAAAVCFALWMCDRSELKATRAYAEATERRFYGAAELVLEAIREAIAAYGRSPAAETGQDDDR